MFSSGRTVFFGYLTIPEKLWVLSLREGDGELTKHVGRSCLEKKNKITSCMFLTKFMAFNNQLHLRTLGTLSFQEWTYSAPATSEHGEKFREWPDHQSPALDANSPGISGTCAYMRVRVCVHT